MNVAACGFIHSDQKTNHRGFTASRWAHNGQKLAIVNVEIDISYRNEITEILGDMSELKNYVRFLHGIHIFDLTTIFTLHNAPL